MNTKHISILLTALVLAGLALAACGGGGGGGAAPNSVTLVGDDTLKFSPTSLTVKAGDTLNGTFQNKGALDHTFVIDALGVKQAAAPGQSVSFSLTPTSAGTYEFYCDVPGHKEAGMTGTLTVTP